jgi:hypothetical protein
MGYRTRSMYWRRRTDYDFGYLYRLSGVLSSGDQFAHRAYTGSSTMTEKEKLALLFGPYIAPDVRIGDRCFCLARPRCSYQKLVASLR